MGFMQSRPVRRLDTMQKFCCDSLNRSGEMAIVSFCKMAAVRHLGFVVLVLVVVIVVQNLVGVDSGSENIRILMLYKFGLNMPIPGHFLG